MALEPSGSKVSKSASTSARPLGVWKPSTERPRRNSLLRHDRVAIDVRSSRKSAITRWRFSKRASRRRVTASVAVDVSASSVSPFLAKLSRRPSEAAPPRSSFLFDASVGTSRQLIVPELSGSSESARREVRRAVAAGTDCWKVGSAAAAQRATPRPSRRCRAR